MLKGHKIMIGQNNARSSFVTENLNLVKILPRIIFFLWFIWILKKSHIKRVNMLEKSIHASAAKGFFLIIF